MMWRTAAACLAVATLGLAPVMADDLRVFRSREWRVTVAYPVDLVTSDTFRSDYFDRGAWRFSYAADSGPGTRVLALSLPDLKASDAGGDSVATAELRIGVSRDPDSVSNCLSYGLNSGNNVEMRTRMVGGVSFTEVPDNTDSEMMKTIATDDLRAVHNGACYAIDVVVYVGGTSNRRLAFSDAQIARLRSVLDRIRLD